MKNTAIVLVAMVVVVLMLSLSAAEAAISIGSYVMGSGGGQISGGSNTISGTIGQAAVGISNGGSYTLQSGFWYSLGGVQQVEEIVKLDDAKSLADGTRVHATGKIATTDSGDFSSFFYIEEADRSSGIRVVAASVAGTVVRGATIEVTGIMATTSPGERYIDQATVNAGGTSEPLGPVGMTNKTVGGSAVGTPPLGQYGVPGGVGTNNVGLLVRVWGEVQDGGFDYIVIDDGSGVMLRVDTTAAPTTPTFGYVTVTGISSLYGSAGTRERLVLGVE